MKIFTGFVLVVLFIAIMPLHLTNAYLRTSNFDRVVVKQGDNVWTIAEKYTREHKEVRELAAAIHEVNALNREGRVVPGQVLKVPVLVDSHN